MGGLCRDLQNFMDDLSSSLDDVMQTGVADAIKNEISETAEKNVYEAYEPRFYSRRMENGGVMDTRTMEQAYDGRMKDTKTIEVYSGAEWQQLWGGDIPEDDLTDAIENGTWKYNMGRAGERLFYKPAEKNLIRTRLLDAIIQNSVQTDVGGKTYSSND